MSLHWKIGVVLTSSQVQLYESVNTGSVDWCHSVDSICDDHYSWKYLVSKSLWSNKQTKNKLKFFDIVFTHPKLWKK